MITFGTWLRDRLAEMTGGANGAAAPGAKDDPVFTQFAANLAAIRQLIEDERKARILEKWRQQQAALLLLSGLAVITAIILLPVNPEILGKEALGASRTWVVHHVDSALTILGVIVGFGTIFVGWLAQPRWLRGARLVIAIVTIGVAWPYLGARQLSVVTLPAMLVGALALVGAQPPDLLGRSRARPDLFKAGVILGAISVCASLLVAVWSEFAPGLVVTYPVGALFATLLISLGWAGGPIGVFLVWQGAGDGPADSAQGKTELTRVADGNPDG